MDVGAGLYMYVVVVQKFTFAISSPDEFLYSPAHSHLQNSTPVMMIRHRDHLSCRCNNQHIVVTRKIKKASDVLVQARRVKQVSI